MNDLPNEYLPSDTPTGHRKIFRLERVEDGTTQKILDARMKVVRDKAVPPQARLLFALLLDLAVREGSYYLFGSVCISKFKLAELLGMSRRTIYNLLHGRERRAGLVQRGHLWISSDYLSNMWARNVYHVTALDPQELHQDKAADGGHYGNGKTRGKAPDNLGCRQPGQRFLPGLSKRPVTLYDHLGNELPTSDFAQVLDFACGTGNGVPAAQATAFPRRRQLRARGAGNGVPAAQATAFPRDGQQCARGAGNGVPAREATVCPQREAKVEAEASTEGGGEPAQPAQTPPESLAEWEAGLKDVFPSRLEAIKTELLAALRRADPADDATQEDLRARIAAIERRIYGRPLPRARKAKVEHFIAPAAAPKAATEEELLEGARYLVECGKANLLTAAQRAALNRIGEQA